MIILYFLFPRFRCRRSSDWKSHLAHGNQVHLAVDPFNRNEEMMVEKWIGLAEKNYI